MHAAQLRRLPPSGQLLGHLRLAPVVVVVVVDVVAVAGRIGCLVA